MSGDDFGFIPDPEPAADFGFVPDEPAPPAAQDLPPVPQALAGRPSPLKPAPEPPLTADFVAPAGELRWTVPGAPEETPAWQRKQERDEGLRVAFRLSAATDLDTEQRILQVSKVLGVPTSTVRANLGAFQATAALAGNDPDRWSVENPQLAQLVTERPDLGPIVVQNQELSVLTKGLLYASELVPLSGTELIRRTLQQSAALIGGEKGVEALNEQRVKAWDKIGAPRPTSAVASPEAKAAEGNPLAVAGIRFREARQQAERGRLGFALLQQRIFRADTTDTEQQLHDLELQSTPAALNEGPVMKVVSDAASGVGSSMDAFAAAIEKGGFGATVAGLGVLAVTKNPVAAAAAAEAGAGMGARFGAAEATYQLEAGGLLLDLKDAKDEHGNPLDPDVVNGMAVVGGLINTGIEMAEFELQLKTLEPLKAAMKGDIGGLKRLLATDAGLRGALKSVGRSHAAQAAMGEPAEEYLQQKDKEAVQWVGTSLSQGSVASVAPLLDQGPALENAGAAIPAGAAMGGFSPALALTLKPVLALSDAARRAGQEERGAKQLPAVLALARDKSVQAAPEAFAALVQQATADTGAPLTALHVDAQAILRYYQDKVSPDDAARELDAALGEGGAQKVAEAAVSGQRLVVPMETVLSTWGASEVGQALVQDSATTPTGPTLRERTPETLKATEDAARALADEQLAQAAKEQALTTQAAELEQQLVATGTLTREQARAVATVEKHLTRTLGKVFGRTVAELFPHAPIVVAKGDEQATTAGRVLQTETEDATPVLLELARITETPTRIERTFGDPLTRLFNKQGFDQIHKETGGGLVAAMTSTDTKPINDVISHPKADEFLAAIGDLVAEHDARGGRTGTNFLFRVDSLEQAQQLAEAWRQRLPENVRLSVGVGDTSSAALANLDDRVDAGRAKGRVDAVAAGELDTKTGEPLTAGFDDAELMREFPDEPTLPAQRSGTAVNLEAIRGLAFPQAETPRTFRAEPTFQAEPDTRKYAFNQFWEQALNGDVLSRAGFDAVGDRAWTLAVDGIGIKTLQDNLYLKARQEFGWTRPEAKAWARKMGDKAVQMIAKAARKMGGHGVNFARWGSDEFAAKHNDRQVLVEFFDDLRQELADSGGLAVDLPTGETLRVPVDVRGETGETYEQADEALNAAKKVRSGRGEGVLLPSGPEVSDRRARRAERRGVFDPSKLLDESGVRAEGPGAGQEVGAKRVTQEGDTATAPKGYTHIPEAAAAARVIKVFLNKSADVSTAVHEVAHAWLELYGRLAERPDAPERVRATYAEALKGLGVERRTDVTREHHEKWARSFEAYLLEGKAPKAELRSVFNKLKRWMMEIYRTVAGIPGAALNPELRRAFDAMLATEDELEAYRAKQGPGLFATAKEAGVTEEEWQAQQEALHDAVTEGGRKAELRALKDAQRVTEAWWKAGLEKLRGVFGEEYDALPAVRAKALLDEHQVVMDRSAVEAVIGKASVPGLKLAADGVRPADVAELAGWPNASSMLAALAALKPKDVWVEEQAQVMMAEQHPGVLERREELQKLIADGLTSYTEKRLAADDAALRKRDPTLGVIPMQVLKRAAALMVERRTLGQLTASVALAQERAAAVRARKAAGAGEWAKAHEAVRQQALNAFLHRELLQAREERGLVEALAQRLGEKAAREGLGKASPAYRDAVDYLVEAVGLREPMHAQALDLRALDAAVAQMNGDRVLIGDPDWLEPVSKAVETPWKKLDVAQMRAVHDALVMLRHAATRRASVLDDERRVDRAQAKAEIIREAGETLRKRSPEAEKHARTALERIAAGLNAGDGYLLSGLDLLRDLTGDNPDSTTWRTMALPLRRAEHREADLLQRAVKPIVDAFEAMPKDLRASLHDRIDGEGLFPTHRTDLPVPRRVYELLMLGLNAGNESNLRLLTEGRGITVDQVTQALDTLPAAALAWIQAVWDACESLKEEAFALEQRVTGLRPRAIEPTSLTLKQGTLRGGYFPAKAIAALSRAGELQQADAVAALFDPTYTRPATAHGHLKSRSAGAVYPLSLDPGTIYRHLYQVAHDIAFREPLQSVGSLVLDPDIKAAQQERLGVEKRAGLLTWLKAIGGANGGATTAATWMTAWVKSNMASALLSGVTTALGNLGNIPAAVVMSPIKAKHLGAGLAEFIAHPVATRRRVLERSGQLRAMSNDVVAGFQREMKTFTEPAWARGLEWTKEAGMALMRGIDVIVNTAVWAGAERQALAEGRDAAWAVRFADDVVSKIASQSSPVERAAILNDKGVGGLLTVFYGYLSVGYRAQHRIAMPLFEQEFEKAGAVGKTKTVAKVAGGLVALYVGLQLLPELLMSRGPEGGDRDEEDPDSELLKWRNWFLRKLLVAPFSLLPVLPFSTAIEGVLLGKRVNPKADPVSQFAFMNLQALTHVLKGAPNLDELMRVLGIWTGQPVRLVGPGGKYLWEVVEGGREVRSGPAFVGGMVRGEKADQPEDVFTLIEALLGD